MMKTFFFTSIISFISITLCAQEYISNYNGNYFGQTPPKDSAVIFAPGIFSLPNRLESNITFTPDGKAFYFGVLEIKDRKVSYKIYQSTFTNNKWSEQTEVPFSLNQNIADPVLSADGKKLYFNKDGDIWVVERTYGKWSVPQKLPAPINSEGSDGSITESANGDIFISSRRSGGFGGIDIWRINRLADQSLQAENLDSIINSRYFDYSPFIAPDGSYLIFGSYRAGRDGLLYISFNKGNDEWTAPLDMNSCGAKVNNTTAHHSNPSLSPDGKYLFFRRHEADTVMDVYWVSAKIIDKLRTKAMQDYSTQEYISNYIGDYFGLTPPKDSAIIFAPGVISVTNRGEYALSISPNHDEYFYNTGMSADTTQPYGLLHIKRVGDKWLKPKNANLNQKDFWEQEAFFNYDGNKIYYAVSVLVSDTVHTTLWVSNKTKNGWSDGEPLNSPINASAKRVFYATFSKNGNLYYTNVDSIKIHMSENNNGRYNKFKEIGLPRAGHAYIAPDEDFILFDSRQDDTYGETDIYIAFKTNEGNWGEPINLGSQINTEYLETCPSLSPDGKYIFFGRYNDENEKSNIYWISSSIIDKLKKKDI